MPPVRINRRFKIAGKCLQFSSIRSENSARRGDDQAIFPAKDTIPQFPEYLVQSKKNPA
jgi:hypothetical protein